MIRLRDQELDEPTARALSRYQAEIDRLRSYPRQVEAAKAKWTQYSRNAVFSEVKRALERMCCGARRCAYCEDSYADEVEHFRPKDLYPEHVFRWPNYAYSCGACNGPKNNQFAVFTKKQGAPTVVTPPRDAPVRRPPKGPIALIDPRSENPLKYLWLDLGSFFFTENGPEGSRTWHRAHYTIETLGLNRREAMITARKSAYESYRARLKEYRDSKTSRAPLRQLDAMRQGIQAMHHQTVFAEMQRQRTMLPELGALFDRIPEATGWRPVLWKTNA